MRQILILIIGCYSYILLGQQQQMYTQFMFNKLSFNPAYAGNETYTSATLMYRDQWYGFQGAPKAQLLSINLPRFGKRVGLGFNLERQSIGVTQKLTYQGMYAYKFDMGEGTLSMGIGLAGRRYSLDFTDPKLYAVQGIAEDPAIDNLIFNKNVFNAGFGVYFNTPRFYIGAAIPRMIKSDLDFDSNNLFSTEVRHLWAMSGATFTLSKDWRFTPQLLIKTAEDSPLGLDVNVSGTYKERFTIGSTYRTGGAGGDLGESFDIISAVNLSEKIVLGFAYDIPLSTLRTATMGSLEIMLLYNFIPKKIKTVVINPRYF
jgi:type IX secretion system PorP/SprF family membrane protein